MRCTSGLTAALVAVVCGGQWAGCGSSASARRDSAPLERAASTAPADATPARAPTTVAVINGRAVSWDMLQPRLAEASGAAVLEELILDVQLEALAAERGMTIESIDLDRERELLVRQIGRQVGTAEAETEELVATIRRRQGLGPERFAAMLRRNAMLRRLVADAIQVEPAEVERLYSVRYGPKWRARVITVPTEREAAELRAELAPLDPPQRATRFAQLAVDRSTDESAPRGGLLEPISIDDPAYPGVVRSALAAMQPGELSGVLAVGGSFALLLLERIDPAQPVPLDDVRAALEQELRARMERVRMDELARQWLRDARVTLFDPSLRWSWQERRSADR